MLTIKNTRVLGMGGSLVAATYPMSTEDVGTSDFDEKTRCVDKYAQGHRLSLHERRVVNDLVKRGARLGKAPNGSGHDCFLKGIVVQYDLTAPEYFWRQFDRYHFHDYISSSGRVQ